MVNSRPISDHGLRYFEKLPVVKGGAKQLADPEPSDNGCGQWDTQEHGDACGSGGVLQGRSFPMADDADEEESERSKEDHLQDRVDGYKDSAILSIATSESCPYQNLDHVSRTLNCIRHLEKVDGIQIPLRYTVRVRPRSILHGDLTCPVGKPMPEPAVVLFSRGTNREISKG